MVCEDYRLPVGGLEYEIDLEDGRLYRLGPSGGRRPVESVNQERMVLEQMAREPDTPAWRMALGRILAHRFFQKKG